MMMCMKFKRVKKEKKKEEIPLSGSSSPKSASSSSPSSSDFSKPIPRRVRFDIDPETLKRISLPPSKVDALRRQDTFPRAFRNRSGAPLRGSGLKRADPNISEAVRMNSQNPDWTLRGRPKVYPQESNPRISASGASRSSVRLSGGGNGELQWPSATTLPLTPANRDDKGNEAKRRQSLDIRTTMGIQRSASGGWMQKTSSNVNQMTYTRGQSYQHPPNAVAQLWRLESNTRGQGRVSPSHSSFSQVQSPAQQLQNLRKQAQSPILVTQREIAHHRRNSTQVIHQQHMLYQRQASNQRELQHHQQQLLQEQQQHHQQPQQTILQSPAISGLHMHPLQRNSMGPMGYAHNSSASQLVGSTVRRHSTPTNIHLESPMANNSVASLARYRQNNTSGNLACGSTTSSRASMDMSGLAYFHKTSPPATAFSPAIAGSPYHRSITPRSDSNRRPQSRLWMEENMLVGDIARVNNGAQMMAGRLIT